MIAIEALNGVAALAAFAFVAARRIVVEVVAASPLHQVATNRRHIPNLRRGARQYRLRQHGIAFANSTVAGNCGVLRTRVDDEAAILRVADFAGKSCDVNHHLGAFDILAHQIDEIGAAAEVFCLYSLRKKLDRCCGVRGFLVAEWRHDASSSAKVSRTASTIPL